MTQVSEIPVNVSSAPARRFETFSYLPPMDRERIRALVDYLVRQGWTPAIEHTEPGRRASHYWYLWKLPLFGERDVDRIMGELDECRQAFPEHHIRLIGYDRLAQTQGTAAVVYRGAALATTGGCS